MPDQSKAVATLGNLTLAEKAQLVEGYYALAFSHTQDKDEAAKKLTVLISQAAEKQIRSETHDESPWKVQADDSAEVAQRKAMIFERAVITRSLEISEARRLADEQAQFYLVKHFAQRQLEMFPEDGTFEDLETIVRRILPATQSGSVLQVLDFFTVAEKAIEASSITTGDIIDLVHKRGAYALGRIQTAVNQELGDDATPDEVAAKYEELFEEADAKSKSEWQRDHGGPKSIPPMDYAERKGNDGTSMFVIVADTSRQRELLLNRLSGQIKRSDTLSAEGPVTPDKLYKAMSQAAQCKQFDLMNYLRGLMEAAVLQNGPCYDVHTVLTHADGYLTLKEFDVIPDLSRATIMDALRRLNHYGLVIEITHKEKPGDKGVRMWGLPPKGDESDEQPDEE